MKTRFIGLTLLLFLQVLTAPAQGPIPHPSVADLKQKLKEAVPDTERVNVLNQLAYELRRGDTASARKYASEALQLSKNESFYKGQAAAYANLGEYHRTRSDYDQALEQYHFAIDICTEHSLRNDLAKMYNRVGVIYQIIADYEQALQYYQKSLPISKELDDKQAIAGTYNNIGNIHYLHGEYTRAVENYLASLKIREQAGDKAGIAASYNNIANVFSEQRNYERALEYYNKGIEIKKELNDQKGLANTYSNVGSLYFFMNENKKAMDYYLLAKDLSEAIKDDAQLAATIVNIGKIQSESVKDYKAALKSFEEAGEIYYRVGDKRGVAIAYSSLGALHNKNKRYGDALVPLEKGLKIALSIGLKEEIKNAYFGLAEASEGLGEYKKASEYLRQFISVKDSLFNEASNQTLSELETKYRSGKKQKEIDLLKKEKEIQAVVVEKEMIVIYACVAVILLILFVTFLIWRNNRRKHQLNTVLVSQFNEITRQKEEKDVLLKEVHHRVKNNLQVISSLLNIQSLYIGEERISALFSDCQNRIRSMALIHEKLYSSPDLNKVQLESYLESLAKDLFRSYNLNQKVRLDLEIAVESFDVNTLIPVGLLLNELLSNSLKHAFPDDFVGEGVIRISLKSIGSGGYEMMVGDNGVGIPEGKENTKNEDSLGLELVDTFVKQLDGTIERLDANGTVYRIVFGDVNAGRRAAATS